LRLLFDQNLSPRLVRLLSDVYPECAHVHDFEMDRASDTEVWRYAAEHGYTIVSKDADFHQRSLLFGAPPKVIWIRQGNCSVADTADLLRERFIAVERFHAKKAAAFLALS
jgi:predicted nuclease of predicted toxin-antitoxin system